jgi:hypothetical protein
MEGIFNANVMAEASASQRQLPTPTAVSSRPPQLDPDSVWTRIQQASLTIPSDVIDKLAELDLELSEGKKSP